MAKKIFLIWESRHTLILLGYKIGDDLANLYISYIGVIKKNIMHNNVPFKNRVQRYVSESLETLFDTTAFALAVRRVIGKRITGVSEFTGKGTGLVQGDRVTILEVKASDIRGIYLMSGIEAVGNSGFKTVEFSVSPPATNAPTTLGTNGLGKSFTGGTAGAQFDAAYDSGTDTIKVYLENVSSANPPDVYGYSYKVTVFYK